MSARAVDAVASHVEVKVIAVQCIEAGGEDDGEDLLVVRSPGDRPEEPSLGGRPVVLEGTEILDHGNRAATLEDQAPEVDGVRVAVLAHHRGETRHATAAVRAGVHQALHAGPE